MPHPAFPRGGSGLRDDEFKFENGKLKAMGNYDDIINLPHHVSERHPQMSMWNRAAQFAPFAALTGYDEAIRKTTEKSKKK